MPQLSKIAILCGLLFALPATAGAQKLTMSFNSLAAHDTNRVFLRVSNRGGFGLALSDADGGNFPQGTLNRYIFGAGLWIGGIGDVDDNGQPDRITSIGYNPSNLSDLEWIEGTVAFGRNDPRFRVLDSTDPNDQDDFPATPVATQELFAVYGDRFSTFGTGQASVPLGVEVRQRSFTFAEVDLNTAVIFQWDFLNISDQIRSTGYTIEDLWTGIVLDPDIQVSPVGSVLDDTAAPLTVDGEEILLIWDSDFSEPAFEGVPGFMAVVPLVNPGGQTTITQMTSQFGADVRIVPTNDADQYDTLAGIAPRDPTIVEPGFDLRALIGWGAIDLAPGAVHRTAAAFVWADAAGDPPSFLSPLDPTLDEDLPLLADLVAAVRSVRDAYDQRLAGLPALLDFPGDPGPGPGSGEPGVVLQNFPNPFTDQTTIQYSIVDAADVQLKVFDITGREVTTLADGFLEPGEYSASWDGRSTQGVDVPAGVYVIRLVTPAGTSTVRGLKAR